MPDVSPRLTFISWAHGAARPVLPGYSGPSASGWTVQNEVEVTDLKHHIVASRTSNRTHWEARIMAVRGVVETVPCGSIVRVRINDKTLVAAFSSPNGRFIRKDFSSYDGREFWRPLIELIVSKDLDLIVELADESDVEMNALIEEVSQAALEKLRAMGPEEALKSAIPPKAKKKRQLFPPYRENQPIADPES
jgi:hypothetical protein